MQNNRRKNREKFDSAEFKFQQEVPIIAKFLWDLFSHYEHSCREKILVCQWPRVINEKTLRTMHMPAWNHYHPSPNQNHEKALNVSPEFITLML